MDLNVISLTPWFLYWSQSVSYHWKHPSKHLRYSSRLMGTNHKFCNLCNKLIDFFFLRGGRFLFILTIVTLRKFQSDLSFSNNMSLITENSQNSRKRWRWWRFLPSDTEGWWGKRAESEIMCDLTIKPCTCTLEQCRIWLNVTPAEYFSNFYIYFVFIWVCTFLPEFLGPEGPPVVPPLLPPQSGRPGRPWWGVPGGHLLPT